MVWIDRAGRVESLGLPARAVAQATLSPDGRRIAVARLEGGAFELWMNDVARKTEDRLDLKGINLRPVWGPRGDRIAFVSERKGEYDTYTARPDGSDVQPLLTKDFDEAPLAWTHDGRRLIDKEWHPDGSTPVSVIDLDSGPDHRREVLIPNSAGLVEVALSRDDRWLLFTGTASGRREVYVQALRGQQVATRVSSNGGTDPFWSPAGGEIVFRHGDQIVSVSFRPEGDRVVIGRETVLFRLSPSSALYSIAPDGRFLAGRLADPEPPPGIRVVVNWFEELKGRGVR